MGYMIVDDRKSGGKVVETDTIQCPHCQRHLPKFRPGQASGAFCMKCGKPVCDRRPCNTGCLPFLKKIEQAMARQAMFQAIGLKG